MPEVPVGLIEVVEQVEEPPPPPAVGRFLARHKLDVSVGFDLTIEVWSADTSIPGVVSADALVATAPTTDAPEGPINRRQRDVPSFVTQLVHSPRPNELVVNFGLRSPGSSFGFSWDWQTLTERTTPGVPGSGNLWFGPVELNGALYYLNAPNNQTLPLPSPTELTLYVTDYDMAPMAQVGGVASVPSADPERINVMGLWPVGDYIVAPLLRRSAGLSWLSPNEVAVWDTASPGAPTVSDLTRNGFPSQPSSGRIWYSDAPGVILPGGETWATDGQLRDTSPIDFEAIAVTVDAPDDVTVSSRWGESNENRLRAVMDPVNGWAISANAFQGPGSYRVFNPLNGSLFEQGSLLVPSDPVDVFSQWTLHPLLP